MVLNSHALKASKLVNDHIVLNGMDEPMEDEKKPFDTEGGQDDDTQPDPDEHLMLDQGNGRVWLVRVSEKFSDMFIVP